jgi:hypothetical protein
VARNNTLQGLGEQVRRNLVALISLVVAVSSLGYNTWRNERTEYNRNQRQASFQMLLALGELRELAYHLQYDSVTVGRQAERSGWTKVFAIRDFSMLLQAPIPAEGEALYRAWDEHSQSLGSNTVDRTHLDAIEARIDELRDETLAMLQALD